VLLTGSIIEVAMRAGLSPTAKAGSVIGTFVLLGFTIKALDEDSERASTNAE